MQFDEIVRERKSVKVYDPEHLISDEELRAIFEQVILSPSSFNLQHWRFVVVRKHELKEQLCAASWNQTQVRDASAVVIVLGKLNAYEDADEIYAEAPENVRQMLLPMIPGAYEGKPQIQRDEAIRSGSLAAMTLMYACTDAGYDTCPMIGFDAEKICELTEVEDGYLPVMMVVIGKRASEPRPRSHRYPPETVVRLETFSGPGLA